MKKALFYSVGVGPRRPGAHHAQGRANAGALPCGGRAADENGEMLALSIAQQAVSLEGKPLCRCTFTMSRDKAQQHAAHLAAAQALRPHLDAGRDVAMLNLGDVSIYATAAYLADNFGRWMAMKRAWCPA